ncbi:MAG: acyltransferase family protein [Rhodospirillaceae bacterium]|nr:acyltransferase family protein [Rhodospirillaceae bacterium]
MLVLAYFPYHYLHTDGNRGTVPAFFISRLLSDFLMLKSIGYGEIFNGPSWSLYVEVLFYVLLPAVLVVARGRMAAVGILAYFGFVIAGYALGDAVKLFAYFGLGILLARWAIQPPRFVRPSRAPLLAVLGLAFIFLDVAVEWRTEAAAALKAFLPVLGNKADLLVFGIGYAGLKGPGLVLLILALLASPVLRRPLEWPALRLIGVVSYSLFLLHPFVISADFAFRPNAKEINELIIPAAAPAWWIVPLIYAPAFILWAMISFAFIERTFLFHFRPKLPSARMVEPESRPALPSA